MHAAGGGHVMVVVQLLVAEADINSVDKDGFTPLSQAASNGHTEIVPHPIRIGTENGRVARSAEPQTWVRARSLV
jgi:ankyrin repeat protein